MGSVQVKYKEKRGIYEAGSEIQDPHDFFEDLLTNQFGEVKALYDQQDPDNKAQIDECFNGTRVLSSQAAAQMWFDEVQGEPEDLQAAKDAIMPWLTM